MVLPYIEATQSGVLPLAFAYKKPVIATNVGSIPELIRNNKEGLLVNPKSSAEIAKAIIRLAKNVSLRRTLASKAYQKLKKEMNWNKIAYDTINIYKKCLRN